MKTRKIALLAILISIGVILQIFENSLPIISGIPGGKLGIANIITILCISLLDNKSALIFCILRPVLSSLIYGGITQMLFSLSGSILSYAVMLLIIRKTEKFSYYGVAVFGAMAHNIAQVTVAVILYSNIYIYTYLPPLLIISVICGYFTGFCSTIILKKYNKRKII